jgi:hypothetical protein
MTTRSLWRAAAFALVTLAMQVLGAAWAFWQGSVWANWIVAGLAAFAAAMIAPWLAGTISRRYLGLPSRPSMAVLWVAAGFCLAFLAGLLIGLRAAPDAWGSFAVYAGGIGTLVSAAGFALFEPHA